LPTYFARFRDPTVSGRFSVFKATEKCFSVVRYFPDPEQPVRDAVHPQHDVDLEISGAESENGIMKLTYGLGSML
jgi:hypothetical protein